MGIGLLVGFDPMKIGDRIRQARLRAKMSQWDLARAIGVKSQNTIMSIESGTTKQSKHLPKIAEILGLKLRDLYADLAFETEGMQIDVPPPGSGRGFPVYAAAEGGNGALILSHEPIEFVEVPGPLLGVRAAYGVLVTGDSMSPAFEPGDTLLVHPHLPCIPDTDVVLYAELEGEVRLIVKRLRRASAETWFLRQWNPPDDEKQDFTLPRRDWPKCHRIIGKYSRK